MASLLCFCCALQKKPKKMKTKAAGWPKFQRKSAKQNQTSTKIKIQN